MRHLWYHGETTTFTEAHELNRGSPGQHLRNQIGFIKNFKALNFPNRAFYEALPLYEELVGKVTATWVHDTTPSILHLNELY